LSKLQRLLSEGDFTATYKFALLISLADLAVEIGADDGATLLLTNRQIAQRFVQLYWRHSMPDFLFSISRQSLALIGNGLRKLDGARCFYCELHAGEADVDHFIPFILYPRDLMHSFVLAHPGCNRSKSDSLAGRSHLERWLGRLSMHSDALAEIGFSAGVAVDAETTRRVASRGYANAYHSGAHAWVAPTKYEVIDAGHCSLFDS
jgi:HNH endonuclease